MCNVKLSWDSASIALPGDIPRQGTGQECPETALSRHLAAVCFKGREILPAGTRAGAKVPVPAGLGGSRAAGRGLRWSKEPWIKREVGGRGGSRIEGLGMLCGLGRLWSGQSKELGAVGRDGE